MTNTKNKLNKDDVALISEVVVTLLAKELIPFIKKIIKEETKRQLILLKENKTVAAIKKIPKQSDMKNVLKKIWEEASDTRAIKENLSSKTNFPSTGIKALDEAIATAKTEKEMSDEQAVVTTSKKLTPIEEVYINNAQVNTVDDALKIDYTAFVEQMDGKIAERIKDNQGLNITHDAFASSMMSSKQNLFEKDNVIEEQQVNNVETIKKLRM